MYKLLDNINFYSAEETDEHFTDSNVVIERERAIAAEKTLTDNLTAETTRAKAAEKTNADAIAKNASAISTEVTRAKAAEQANTEAITKESNRASAKESELALSILTESNRASTKESELASSILAESNRANAAEKTLTDNLAAETTRAKAAEKILTDNLTTEVTRAKAAEKTNADAIAKNASAISTEVTRAKAAEKTLTDNLTAETTRAKAAEKTNADAIAKNASAISTEVTRAKAAEKTLTDNLATKLNTNGTNATQAALHGLFNTMQSGMTVPVDDDYYVSQYAAGGTANVTPVKRSLIYLWKWIKGHCDAVYSLLGHKHSANDITSGVLSVAHGGTGNSSVDSTPTADSTKMVTSGGVKAALDAIGYSKIPRLYTTWQQFATSGLLHTGRGTFVGSGIVKDRSSLAAGTLILYPYVSSVTFDQGKWSFKHDGYYFININNGSVTYKNTSDSSVTSFNTSVFDISFFGSIV